MVEGDFFGEMAVVPDVKVEGFGGAGGEGCVDGGGGGGEGEEGEERQAGERHYCGRCGGGVSKDCNGCWYVPGFVLSGLVFVSCDTEVEIETGRRCPKSRADRRIER